MFEAGRQVARVSYNGRVWEIEYRHLDEEKKLTMLTRLLPFVEQIARVINAPRLPVSRCA